MFIECIKVVRRRLGCFLNVLCTFGDAQKMKFPIKDFFSKCDQFGHIYQRNPEWKASFFMYL